MDFYITVDASKIKYYARCTRAQMKVSIIFKLDHTHCKMVMSNSEPSWEGLLIWDNFVQSRDGDWKAT